MRRRALRHRLAQLDDAGIDRALDADDDAKADPAAARAVADDVRRLRRDDPARAGEASIAREIERRRRDGRIDSPAEEARARYALRWQAQARRGIPEAQRRLFTNEERAALAAEYLRIEAQNGKDAADQWLAAEAQGAGTHAERFKSEIIAPRTGAPTPSAESSREPTSADDEVGRVEPVQDKKDADRRQARPTPSVPGETRGFGEEVQKELRRRHPSGPIPREELIEAIADAVVGRNELPSNTALYLVGAMAGANPDDVRFAAAHAIARIAREAPDTARSAFEPWVVETAPRLVQLDHEARQRLDPTAPEFAEERRNILRRVHLESGFILPPEFGAFVAAGAGGLAARRARQLARNVASGAKAQELGIQNLRRDLEPYGFAVTGVQRFQTKLGDTLLDSTIRTKGDQIAFLAEVKVPKARFRRPQREKQEALGNVFLFRVDPRTGATEVFKVGPSTKSYAQGTGTPYDKWLASFTKGRRRK